VCRPDSADQVREAMLQSPCRSARQQAVTLALLHSSIQRILHEYLHYNPYKLQVAQELSEPTSALQSILRLEQQSQHFECITDIRRGSLPHVRLCE
jgi:septum formation topological specificity factor MinE